MGIKMPQAFVTSHRKMYTNEFLRNVFFIWLPQGLLVTTTGFKTLSRDLLKIRCAIVAQIKQL